MFRNRNFFNLLGLSLLWILVASCASAAVTSLTVVQNQSTTIETFAPEHAPTPPLLNPVVVATVAPHPTEGPPPIAPVAVSTANDRSVTMLPTPTPEDAPIPLSQVGLPGKADEAQSLATITAQLQQPLEEQAIEEPTPEVADPMPSPVVTETNAIPEAPVGQAPLPVAEAVLAPAQLPADLTWDGVPRTVKVPILMYHYLSVPPASADIYRKDLSVAPDLFNAQLDRIQAEGYTTISLYELVNHLTTGQALPEKSLIITFDDGYRDNYENAFPALKAHGMKATFFVVMEFINAQRPEYMTWDMLREMRNAGMSVEAHGVDHSSLKKRDRNYLAFQALRSLETLQNELGQRARFISYPAGQYDQNTIEIFHSAGYWAGITTIQGATHATNNLFELRRVRIRGTTSPDELVRFLSADW